MTSKALISEGFYKTTVNLAKARPICGQYARVAECFATRSLAWSARYAGSIQIGPAALRPARPGLGSCGSTRLGESQRARREKQNSGGRFQP
jgi:hypothetical protein